MNFVHSKDENRQWAWISTGLGRSKNGHNYASINVKPEEGDPGHMWGIGLFRRIFGQNPHHGAAKFGEIRSNIPTLGK